eukprot:m51a1_g6009 hypothetical protein (204) ;mRNA; f:46825-53967
MAMSSKHLVDMADSKCLGLSLKTSSVVPTFSREPERALYLSDLATLGLTMEMMVFLDEKKFRVDEAFKRWASFGYAVKGVRLPHRLRRPDITVNLHKCEVIGALAQISQELKLTGDSILEFITNDVPNVMQPFPGPHSVLVLDNMPTHRAHEDEILRALWNVVIQIMNKRTKVIAAAGGDDKFDEADLTNILNDTEMMVKVFS